MEALLALANQESAYLETMEYLNKLENGSEDNHKGDFLGADLLPLLEDTSELAEM